MRRMLTIMLGAALIVAMVGCNEQPKENGESKPKPSHKQTNQTEPKNPPPPEAKPEAAPAPSKDGFVKTKSGLKYKDIKEGKGAAVKSGDTVTVNYTGSLDNGSVFDSSKKPGREPFSFTVDGGMVIRGWDEGLKGMKVGGVRDLVIPSELGYGSQGMPGIPANSTLHFKVELLNIEK